MSGIAVWIGMCTGQIMNTVLIMLSLCNLFQIKKKWWVWPLLAFGSTLSACMVIYIGDWANLPPTFSAWIVTIYICSEDSGWKKISVGLLLGSTFFAWNAIVDNFIRAHSDRFMLPRTLFFALVVAGTRFFAREKQEDLEPRMWQLILLLTMVPVGNVLSVILLSTERWREAPDLRLHFAALVLSLIAFVGLLWTIRVLIRQKKLEQEAMFSRMNQNYYDAMEQQHAAIRRLRHDMANHLQTISVLPEEKRDAYILELLDSGAMAKTLNYCGDPTINAVLSVKGDIFQQQCISCDIRLDIPTELPFEKTDVCAVYANALDNALEACMKLPAEKRKITLESRAGKGMLAIKLINPCENRSADINNGKAVLSGRFLPKTTKADHMSHGYGLRSIEESVKKYGGDLELRQENGYFELFCYMPFP